MAHLVIPTAASAIKDLLKDIKAKHTALGAASPITNLLEDNEIDLDDDITDVDAAMAHDHSASLLRKNAKAFGAVSDNKAKKPMEIIGGIGQLIKTLNKKDFALVGEFGFNITNTGKITLPTGSTERLDLISDIIAKDSSYPAGKSPIAQYIIDNEIDLSKVKDALGESQTFEQKMEEAYARSENETETRNTLMAPVTEHVTLIGNFLMQYYKKEERQLGLWGFTVHNSKKKPKEQTSKIKLLQKVTIGGVVIGGNVLNDGPTDVHIYKGKTTTGNPIILHPGDKWGVPKKYSIITVSNPSDLETAIVKVLVSNN